MSSACLMRHVSIYEAYEFEIINALGKQFDENP